MLTFKMAGRIVDCLASLAGDDAADPWELGILLGGMLDRHGHWSEPKQFFAVSLQETSVKVPENCPPPLVGLEFDSDSSH